jgi:cytochrome P450
VALNRPSFPKPTELYATLSLFGRNIVVSEHDEWRRHRKVTSPAFSERNNVLVFQETTRVVLNLFQMWKEQGKGDMITIPDMTDITFEVVLQVIASAAFGYNITWKDEGEVPEGHKMVRLPFAESCYTPSIYRHPDVSISDFQARSLPCVP